MSLTKVVQNIWFIYQNFNLGALRELWDRNGITLMTSTTRPPQPQEVVLEQNALKNSCRGGTYLHFGVLIVAIALTVMELQYGNFTQV